MAAVSILQSPILPALSISTSVLLLQFGAPSGSNAALNYPLLFMALITCALGICLLALHLAGNAPKPPNLTPTRLTTDHLNTALLAACFTTIMLALLQASLPPNNSSTSPGAGGIFLAWTSQLGLLVLAIAVLQKIIVCPHQQCTKAAFFTLCVAVSGLYLPSPVTCCPVLYPTYSIYHVVLTPFGFVLGVLLVAVGVTVPTSDNSRQYPCVSVSFKEGLAKLTISVGIIILLIRASILVYPLIHNSAVVGGADMTVGAM